jgi:hypothetical protein
MCVEVDAGQVYSKESAKMLEHTHKTLTRLALHSMQIHACLGCIILKWIQYLQMRSAIINFEEGPQPIINVPPGADPSLSNPMLAPPPYSLVSQMKNEKPPDYDAICEHPPADLGEVAMPPPPIPSEPAPQYSAWLWSVCVCECVSAFRRTEAFRNNFLPIFDIISFNA